MTPYLFLHLPLTPPHKHVLSTYIRTAHERGTSPADEHLWDGPHHLVPLNLGNKERDERVLHRVVDLLEIAHVPEQMNAFLFLDQLTEVKH